jgi:SnoaL-like domain
MYGQEEYLIAMQEGAKARLAAEGNDRVDNLSNRTAQEVLDDHLNLSEHWRAEGAKERTAEKDVVRDHGKSSEMDEQRLPNLQEMDEQQAEHFLTELLSNLSPEEEYNVRHPDDYVMEMPQSGERFRGRENLRAFQEARSEHANPPSIWVSRVLVRNGLWVVEAVCDYGGGQVLDAVLIFELRDGKMWRDRWYFAEPFEAPEWRAQWVERMDS